MKKTILEWARDILRSQKIQPGDLKVPSMEVVERLINKGASEEEAKSNKKKGERDKKNETKDEETGFTPPPKGEKTSETYNDSEKSEKTETEEKREESCPYALKRNIVMSLREIRRFAEEHHLASAMIKALLTLLAEMAINALRGKVSSTALAVLLNAMNFDKARSEAYLEGEIAVRNAQISEKYFPSTDDGLPHLGTTSKTTRPGSDIFSMAREA